MDIRKAITLRASSIGDCLMGKYFLENIHLQFPGARLGIVVGGRASMIRDLFSAYPWLDVVEANRRSPRSLFSLFKRFHSSDLVVTQYAGKPGGAFSFASKFAARLLGSHLVGFADSSAWNPFIYTTLLPFKTDTAIAEHERAVLRAVDVPVAIPFPTLEPVADTTVLPRHNLLAGRYIVVHLFSGSSKRGLHPDKKKELLRELSKQLPETVVVISGSKDDREEALRISTGIPARVIAGEASLQDMMHLMKESRIVISVDTGLAHIAAQLGVRLVVLRTCLGRQWWLPEQYGHQARITVLSRDEVCARGHRTKEYPECLNAIAVNDWSFI